MIRAGATLEQAAAEFGISSRTITRHRVDPKNAELWGASIGAAKRRCQPKRRDMSVSRPPKTRRDEAPPPHRPPEWIGDHDDPELHDPDAVRYPPEGRRQAEHSRPVARDDSPFASSTAPRDHSQNDTSDLEPSAEVRYAVESTPQEQDYIPVVRDGAAMRPDPSPEDADALLGLHRSDAARLSDAARAARDDIYLISRMLSAITAQESKIVRLRGRLERDGIGSADDYETLTIHLRVLEEQRQAYSARLATAQEIARLLQQHAGVLTVVQGAERQAHRVQGQETAKTAKTLFDLFSAVREAESARGGVWQPRGNLLEVVRGEERDRGKPKH